MKIGVLAICLGKYDIFVPPLVKSIEQFFLKDHEITLFCFTDKELPSKKGRVKIQRMELDPKEFMPFFPMATLKRYHAFSKYNKELLAMDYLYYCDVDMRFVSEVGEEIFPTTDIGLVGTEHPGFFGGRRGTYEEREGSTAYVSKQEGLVYYAGGFNGGKSLPFLEMSEQIKDNIDKDFQNNIIALWHDESHMNRYFINNPPTTLSPSYCYPESWEIPFEKKLLALDKNHSEIRN